MNTSDPTATAAAQPLAADMEFSVEDIADASAADTPGTPGPAAAPLPLVVLAKRNVSGRYRTSGSLQLELRVDVDGKRPMKKVSGDFFNVSGATTSYFGSFVVESPVVTVTSTLVTITGLGKFTWSAGAPNVKVTIPRVSILAAAADATLQFSTTGGTPGSTYVCKFQSIYFRSVQYEQDRVSSATPFVSYNTGSLPSGGPARVLTVPAAYAEAGIEFQTAGSWNVVSTAGIGSSWSDAELHSAMQTQFSLWADLPQWKVWLFAANLHDLGTGLRGIMFDQKGKQRQGCAVFHDAIGGASAESQRAQLRTYVHELGHCFNLLHSWQKSLATPPQPNRPAALSWMNYVQNYPGGAPAYWAAFPFQFDNPEVVHLRHGFYNNVIPGGNNFGAGAAELDPAAFDEPIEDHSGLKLVLDARPNYALGEPVVVEIKLYSTDGRDKRVSAHLHPKAGFVQLGIVKPGGQMAAYEPVIEHCVGDETIVLNARRPSIYESAYIGYGKDGFYFDQPGSYQVRAIYYALDGSVVVSNILSLRVRSPFNAADEEVADLFLGDDQGNLLALLGSDSDFLKGGRDAFELVLDKHGKHPLAVYARLAAGINAGREFKSIGANKELKARKANTADSVKQLTAVTDATEAGAGVDNITLNQTMRRLATVQKNAGDDRAAKTTMKRMVGYFRKKSLKPHVMQLIEEQAAEF